MFKTDFAEAVPPGTVAWNGASGLDLHNVYTLLYNDAAAEVTEQVHGYRLVWGRSSTWAGSGTPPSGAATRPRPTAGWAARCAAACPTPSAAARSGVTTWAASRVTAVRPVPALGLVRGAVPPEPLPRQHQPAALGPGRRGVPGHPADRRHPVPAAALPVLGRGPGGPPAPHLAAADGRGLPGDRAAQDADGQYLIGTDLLAARSPRPTASRTSTCPPGPGSTTPPTPAMTAAGGSG